ncbi:MAG: carbohydrate-binding domain-containing protein [Lachnospiraceae bacterium]|nr:carbohydrate-binding domain-containing protein [Lachnospiraceae bacterium]
MSKKNIIKNICMIIVIMAAAASLLFLVARYCSVTAEAGEKGSDTEYFTSYDTEPAAAEDADCVIELEGDGGSVEGRGAYFANGDLIILTGGKYLISGELSDGSIIIKGDSSSKVWLIFDGVTLYCEDNAAIRVEQADNVFISLVEGSENMLSSGEAFSEEALADNAKGVIFSHDDITINGSGALVIDAPYKYGIDANDSLHITGGDISITASEDAIHVNDEFNFDGADLTIDAGDDGIHCDEIINILGGSISVNKCYEGLEARIINIADGDVTIYPTDDGINANGNSGSEFGGAPGGMGGFGERPEGFDGQMRGPAQGTEGSGDDGGFRGNKDGMRGPGMHSLSENSAVSGNSAFPERPDDMGQMPPMMDGQMPQGMRPENKDAEGAAGNGTGRGADKASDSEEAEETYINISGGNITIVNSTARDADGLDSNGDITISGGVIRISMTADGNNSAIDYASESGGKLIVTGGDIIGCGSSGMAEGFSEESTQYNELVTLDETAEAGETLIVEDEDGHVIATWEVPCSYNSVIISSPELKEGWSIG